MKVLLVNKYHYVRGGSETYYFGLAELLRKAGCEVIFFAMQDDRNIPCEQSEYFVSNVEFNGGLTVRQKIKAALRMVYSFEAKKKISALIEQEKPDIIHINLFHRVLTASIVDAAKKFQIPVVFTMHDLNCVCPNHTMLDHGSICEACLHGKYLHCVKRVCFKDSRAKCLMAALESAFNKYSGLYHKIDCFITPSEYYRKKLLESGMTKSKVITMRNFLQTGDFFASEKGHLGYYLYFGRLSEEKGILTLLKAIEKVPGVQLEIAGTGPQEQALKTYVEEKNLQNRVCFRGFLSGNDLTQTIQGAKCVVLPSQWYENGPYAIMEAMAAGKPVIVSDLGGLPEIVTDHETGYVFKAFDDESLAERIGKLERLDPCSYRNMSRAAMEQAEIQFSSDRYLEQLLGIYREFIAKKSEM